MLQLKAESVNLSRISKILAKYKVRAGVSNQIITLEGEISDELLNELIRETNILSLQNFADEDVYSELNMLISKYNEVISKVKFKENGVQSIEGEEKVPVSSANTDTQNAITYKTVKRGEVYMCDLGKNIGSEQGGYRPVIIIQNDVANYYSNTTIIVPLTSQTKSKIPTHYEFTFSEENMLDFKPRYENLKKNTVIAEQIKTIDKSRLIKYVGTMNEEFMKKVQEVIGQSLNFIPVPIPKDYQDNIGDDFISPNIKNSNDAYNAPHTEKAFSSVQLKLLENIDMDEINQIVQAKESTYMKIEKILKVFGFDMNKNGMEYLIRAIMVSTTKNFFNLETLCEQIAKKEYKISKEEIQRLIVARVKEQFNLKKAPTKDFIRLVNSLLINKEI